MPLPLICSLLNPDLTASWEKGLTYVAEGTIEPAEYLNKLETFVASRTNAVKQTNNRALLQKRYDYIAQFYRKPSRKASSRKNTKTAEAAKGKESIRKA